MATSLLAARTTNGSGASINLTVEAWMGGCIARWQSAKINVQVYGTFDSCTVTIEGSLDDGTTWSPLDNGDFTTALIRVLDVPPGMYIRATVSSAGASTEVSVLIT